MLARPSVLVRTILKSAIRVHRALGPGLLEAAYESCLTHELIRARIPFKRQVAVPLDYDGVRLDCVYRADLVVDDRVLLEIKSVDHLAPVHTSQVITYLRLLGLTQGILLNFNERRLKDGIKNVLLTDPSERRRQPPG